MDRRASSATRTMSSRARGANRPDHASHRAGETMTDRVSGSRLRRFLRLGWLGRRAIPLVWKRLQRAADDGTPPPALAEELLAKHADVAEEAFATLGDLKGLALKFGQMAAYMD